MFMCDCFRYVVREIVEDTVAERMVAKIRERMTHLRVGDSLDKVK